MTQRALSEHSESTKMALKKYLKGSLESNQREKEQSDFVILSEPKILCLVSVCISSVLGMTVVSMSLLLKDSFMFDTWRVVLVLVVAHKILLSASENRIVKPESKSPIPNPLSQS